AEHTLSSNSADDFAREEQSCLSFKDEDLSVSEHLQAKRARVENIIRGMAASPNADGEAESECEAVRCRRDLLKENKRKQRLPQHQEPKTSKDEECHKLKEQLQSMQRLLHQLQEKILHVHDQNYSESEEREDARSEHSSLRLDGGHKDRVKVEPGGFGSDRAMKNLKETLKCELTRTVSESIDTVFKKLSTTLLNQSSPCHNLSDSEENVNSRHCFESHGPEHQTEALSLVVRKPSLSQAVKRPFPLHQTPFQMGYNAPLHDSQILEHLLKYGPHSTFCLERSSPDSVERPWESLAMRSKLSSGHLGQHQTGLVSVDALCLPHIKMERGDLQSMAERSSFMSLSISFERSVSSTLKRYCIQKRSWCYNLLMWFQTCRTLFNGQFLFNRCITSQLIKWFSNFREFFYIQMEKFARQAIIDGVNDVKDVSVTRESELFRALNMHYNKANDFQVPDRFLEVAEVTLQEFFSAISLSKDSDPSWKKAIYKVICKLDSVVPEDFKSPSYV
uniref:Prospero homeobox protein 1-like n=1 Tax=Sinocyclocheilus grahami TaxID=75366 RepID=A0A672SHT1_SINGR